MRSVIEICPTCHRLPVVYRGLCWQCDAVIDGRLEVINNELRRVDEWKQRKQQLEASSTKAH